MILRAGAENLHLQADSLQPQQGQPGSVTNLADKCGLYICTSEGIQMVLHWNVIYVQEGMEDICCNGQGIAKALCFLSCKMILRGGGA